MIVALAGGSRTLAAAIGEQTQSGRIMNRNITGAAAELELIDESIGEVASATAGVDGLAPRVQTGAALLEDGTTEIHKALTDFFDDLRTIERT